MLTNARETQTDQREIRSEITGAMEILLNMDQVLDVNVTESPFLAAADDFTVAVMS